MINNNNNKTILRQKYFDLFLYGIVLHPKS